MEDKLLITQPHIVIVEGTDEDHLFRRFLHDKDINNIQIINARGESNIKKSFNQVYLSEAFQRKEIISISIIRDADNEPENKETAVRDIFHRQGIIGKLAHNSFSLCKYPGSEDYVYCGFFILPGDGRVGNLETILLEFLQTMESNECVENFFSCLETNNVPLPSDISKSKVQTFISTHPCGVKLVGQAASKGLWDFSHPAFSEIINFLLQQSRLEQ